MPELSDNITIPEWYCRELVKKGNTLDIVKRFVESQQYATVSEIRILLDVKESGVSA